MFWSILLLLLFPLLYLSVLVNPVVVVTVVLVAVVIAALVSVVVVVARIGVADAASFVVLSILKQKSKKAAAGRSWVQIQISIVCMKVEY